MKKLQKLRDKTNQIIKGNFLRHNYRYEATLCVHLNFF